MPQESYCLINSRQNRMFWGIVRARDFHEFISTLSVEALEKLEYLDKEEFKTKITAVYPNGEVYVFDGDQVLFDAFYISETGG